MNKLSLRLKAVADLIEDGSKVIDIGCDHGLLDIYLTKEKKCNCLATDISSTCLKKAIDNIKKYNLNIETKVTNGLEGIDYLNYDYIVISGMGFKTIKKILEGKNPNKLIIQSNNNIEELKHHLLKKYKLADEKIVYENGFYYVISLFEKGKKRYRYSDYIIGLSKDNQEYINYLYNKYKGIYDKMPNKYVFKKIGLYRKIKVIEKYRKALI